MSTKFSEVFLFPAKRAHSEISSLDQPSYSGVGMCDLLTFASSLTWHATEMSVAGTTIYPRCGRGQGFGKWRCMSMHFQSFSCYFWCAGSRWLQMILGTAGFDMIFESA